MEGRDWKLCNANKLSGIKTTNQYLSCKKSFTNYVNKEGQVKGNILSHNSHNPPLVCCVTSVNSGS